MISLHFASVSYLGATARFEVNMPLRQISTTQDFEKIISQWTVQCQKYDEIIENFAKNSLDHARDIVENGATGQNGYSIYSTYIGDDCECILHVNRSELPRTKGVTQKVLWVLFEPHRDCRRLVGLSYAAMGTLSMAAVAA
jgi:hypothetical protein